MTWHVLTLEYASWCCCRAVGTSMTMVLRTMSHRSSGLSVSLNSALEALTFGDCSSINLLACCENVCLNLILN